MASQPTSYNWPANKPSDKISTWPQVRSWGVSIFYINTQVTFVRWPASQLQLASQPAIWQKCQSNQKSDPWVGSGWHLLDGQSVDWPASQLQLASQQAIWQSVNLTLSQILRVSIFYINTQVTFGQMTSQPANCNWPVNQPSDKNVNLTKSQIPGGGSGWHFVGWPVSQLASQPAAIGQPTSHLTYCQPDPMSDLGGCPSFISIHK